MEAKTLAALADLAREILAPVVAEVIHAELSRQPEGPSKKLLTQAELAERLQCSIPTLRREIEAGLPWVPAGDHKRFEYDRVVAWLRGRAA